MIGALVAVRGSGADDLVTVAIFGGGGGGFGDVGDAMLCLLGEIPVTLGLAGLFILLARIADLVCEDPVTGLGNESRTFFWGIA